ncbi:MAG: hypothetical protein DIU67_005970 [Actinomycetes bacterium]|nr:MAG: hypothetical protein DIU67_07050 [Actinomycetota bacterium]
MSPAAIALVVTLLPVMFGSDLAGLLERGGQASYGAEQIVSCATPDGVTSALLSIEQADGRMVVGSDLAGSKAVAMGPGRLATVGDDGAVEQVAVVGRAAPDFVAYAITETGGTRFLGRDATTYRLDRDGVMRAELVLDDLTGVVLRATTYSADGTLYCVQRFISFEPGERTLVAPPAVEREALVPLDRASGFFPEQILGFVRLDEYEDADGLRFTYYSDGFFSFGVFQTPVVVPLPGGVSVHLARGDYQRVFAPGQVFYAWEVVDGGMALIGDLPPDMHDAVLDSLPKPQKPSFFKRIWRTLFGGQS